MSKLIGKILTKGIPHLPHEPALRFENVWMGFSSPQRQGWTLEELTFQVEEGEHLAVIGPNGAGKSTLFNLITGLLKPDKGEIHLFGDQPESHICIAYVPQRNSIDWSFPVTVEDVVMMGRTQQIGLFRRPKKRDWEVVRFCLERVNAYNLAKKQIDELSGGQQQRVFIARALALDTNLLLMDEPLSGLDLPAQETIFEILEGLRPDDVTVMVATHDLTQASERFDRIMLLNRTIIGLGSATAVMTSENLIKAYGGTPQQPQTSKKDFYGMDNRTPAI